jgi:hypothetical protein
MITKGTFLFAPGKSGTKKEEILLFKFVFLSTWNVSFWTREKAEQLFLLQEKIGLKKNIYLYSGKSGT